MNGKKEIGNVKDDALLILFLIFGFADTCKNYHEKQNISKLLIASTFNRISFYVYPLMKGVTQLFNFLMSRLRGREMIDCGYS